MNSLASYATTSTRGRQHFEAPLTQYRSEFQRDRDRIIHSTAFRRLEYKTQVFINYEGDLFRTRLTHSLEVAQIGRSVATALNINVDLVEAICLAHDLGHTPFGHTGQDELNSCMHKACGEGFEHNLQSLRIVDKLEERYADFDGINLTFETRAGILKHCSAKIAKSLGDLGTRFLDNTRPSLEAQLANVADELAYNFHDLDDGLRSGLITLEQLRDVAIVNEELNRLQQQYPNLSGRRLHKELVRHLINTTICDLTQSTAANIKEHKITSPSDVYTAPLLVMYSESMARWHSELKRFLLRDLYQHSSIVQLRFKCANIVRQLFTAFISDANLLPEQYQNKVLAHGLHRVVADYISGMTDRYALRQYNRLFTADNI